LLILMQTINIREKKFEAELVIGKRQFELLPGYPWFRRALQRLGSWFLSILAGVKILDGASGFRAMTRELALRQKWAGKKFLSLGCR